METPEWVKILLGIVTAAGVIAGGLAIHRDIVETQAKLEGRVFSTPERKFKTEQHVEEAKTEGDFYVTLRKLDTVADITIQDARENLRRDSLRDDQVKRNTVTIYQMKVSQDSILSKLDRVLKANN